MLPPGEIVLHQQGGEVYSNKVKWANMDATLEPLLVFWRDARAQASTATASATVSVTDPASATASASVTASVPAEAFGDFCKRVGLEKLTAYAAAYKA